MVPFHFIGTCYSVHSHPFIPSFYSSCSLSAQVVEGCEGIFLACSAPATIFSHAATPLLGERMQDRSNQSLIVNIIHHLTVWAKDEQLNARKKVSVRLKGSLDLIPHVSKWMLMFPLGSLRCLSGAFVTSNVTENQPPWNTMGWWLVRFKDQSRVLQSSPLQHPMMQLL